MILQKLFLKYNLYKMKVFKDTEVKSRMTLLLFEYLLVFNLKNSEEPKAITH